MVDELNNYIEEKVNFGVEERNSSFLNFADSSIVPETENLNLHKSNLGDHPITNPPNNNISFGNFNLPSYVNTPSDNPTLEEKEEENEIDKYLENKNNESIKHFKKVLPEYFYFVYNKK